MFTSTQKRWRGSVVLAQRWNGVPETLWVVSGTPHSRTALFLPGLSKLNQARRPTPRGGRGVSARAGWEFTGGWEVGAAAQPKPTLPDPPTRAGTPRPPDPPPSPRGLVKFRRGPSPTSSGPSAARPPSCPPPRPPPAPWITSSGPRKRTGKRTPRSPPAPLPQDQHWGKHCFFPGPQTRWV